DRHDARTLARLARIDPELLGPVRHRSAQAQLHLTVIRARAELVSARTALVNAARGLVKSYGQRLPKCGTYQVSEKLAEGLSAELREVLVPRGPVSVSEESPGRLFSRVTTWPQELWGERTPDGHQQRRRPVSAHDDGAGSALHSGTFWRRQRSAEMGTQAGGARREKCQEASRGGRGSKAGGFAASVVGRRR